MKKNLGRKLLSFLLALAMVVGLVPGMSLTALAEKENVYSPLEVTGYNVDVIADGSKSGDELTKSVNNYVDEMNNGGCFAFFAGGNDSGRIPADGKVTTTSGIDFQLGTFDDNNTLQLTGANTEGSLTLINPKSGYDKIAILCTGGGGAAGFSITPVYNDGEGDTLNAQAPDWYYGSGIVLKCSRIKANLVDGDTNRIGAIESNDKGPGMYETKVNIDPAKTLKSVKFRWTSGGKLNIFAASVVASKAYEIKFDANGGTGTMEEEYIPSGATLKPNTFKKGTKKFAGWNTQEDGTGTQYEENVPVTLTGDLTLYAQWKYVSLGEDTPVVIKKDDMELTEHPMVGDKLNVSCEASDLAYEWFVDNESKGEASESNTGYTVAVDDIGKTIKVKAYQIKQNDDQPYADENRPTKESNTTLEVGMSEETIKEFVTFAYADETATPGNGSEISTDGKNPATLAGESLSLTKILDTSDTPTIYVRKAATVGTNPGAWYPVFLIARPEAPAGFVANNATDTTTADGFITGVDSTMEYSADNGVTWRSVDQDTIKELIPGTYLIRTKATGNAPHGKSAAVTVGSREIILSDAQKPTAKTGLTTDGSEQVLLNRPAEGLPKGAEKIQYILGTDETTVPTGDWSDEIPTAADAGTYYIWYMVKGDTNHNDSVPQCVVTTIRAKISKKVIFKVANGSWNDGTTADKTVTLEGYEGDTLKLAAAQIPSAGTKPGDTYKTGGWDVVPSADAAISKDTTYTYTYAKKDSIGRTVTFKVANGAWDDGTTADKTVTLEGYEGDALKLAAAQIPAVGTKPGDTYKAGSWDVTPSADTAITADTTYTYSYAKAEAAPANKNELSINAGFKVTQKGSKITVKWGKVEGATGYEVYVQYCGKDFSKTPAKRTTTKTSSVVSKIGGKKIDLKKNFKVYVVAVKKDGDKTTNIAKTITGHIVGRKNTKYTNVKSIKLTAKTLSVAAGETSKIKAKTVLVNKKKKQLSDAHASEFRYASSDESIATVDKNGKVTGVSAGTCTVYVYARNGCAKKVSVTVK